MSFTYYNFFKKENNNDAIFFIRTHTHTHTRARARAYIILFKKRSLKDHHHWR